MNYKDLSAMSLMFGRDSYPKSGALFLSLVDCYPCKNPDEECFLKTPKAHTQKER